MAWEWLAPAAGGIVGLAGIVSTTIVAVSGRRQERALAQERHDHERATTQGQWVRDRRAEAYLDLLEMAECIGQWVGMVHPFLGEQRPLPELPNLEKQGRVFARVIAFGSDDLKVGLKHWREVSLKAMRLAEEISRRDGGDGREQLEVLRGRELGARQELGEIVADELQFRIGR